MESREGIIGWFRFRGKGIGYFGYTFQRLSGLVIVFYLFLHFFVLSNILKGATIYNQAIESIKYGPLDIFLVFDVLLALVIFYHGANGIRLALNELGIGLKHHKLFFYAFEIISMIFLVIFLYYAWTFIAMG